MVNVIRNWNEISDDLLKHRSFISKMFSNLIYKEGIKEALNSASKKMKNNNKEFKEEFEFFKEMVFENQYLLKKYIELAEMSAKTQPPSIEGVKIEEIIIEIVINFSNVLLKNSELSWDDILDFIGTFAGLYHVLDSKGEINCLH